MLNSRTRLHAVAALAALFALPLGADAQTRKDSVVLGMILEPTGLDPTIAPAAAIGEVVHYNVLEGLTKINMDGKIAPLLAESWSIDPDGKVYTFKLKKGVKFQDGEAFDSSDVKFTFERAKAAGSTNKAKKAVFDNMSRIETPDPHTVILVLNQADGNFLFRMGENTAVILDPKSAPTTAIEAGRHRPVQVRRLGQGLVAVAGQERDLPQRRRGQAQQGHVPLHQRPGRAGRGAARRRHRRHAALRRAREPEAAAERRRASRWRRAAPRARRSSA